MDDSPAESLRLATYEGELTRPGAGLLLSDILRGADPQVTASVAVIARMNPDILLLTGFDHDAGLAAPSAYVAALAKAATPYPHLF